MNIREGSQLASTFDQLTVSRYVSVFLYNSLNMLETKKFPAVPIPGSNTGIVAFVILKYLSTAFSGLHVSLTIKLVVPSWSFGVI